MAGNVGSYGSCNARVSKETMFQLSPVVKGIGFREKPQAKGKLSVPQCKGLCAKRRLDKTKDNAQFQYCSH